MILEIEEIRDLTAFIRESVPEEYQRRGLSVGNAARIVVLVNGAEHVPVWVKISKVEAGRYEGASDACYGPIAKGVLFAFDWRHVVDWI